MASSVVLAIAHLLFCTPPLHAQESEVSKAVIDLLNDFRKEEQKATERPRSALKEASSKLAADLIKANKLNDAKDVGEIVRQKLLGKPVQSGLVQLASLFADYDRAREAALTPIRGRHLQRADALIKSMAGKDMPSLLALGEVRKEIEGSDGFRASIGYEPMLVGTWIFKAGPHTMTRVLNRNHTVKAETPAKWSIKDGKLKVEYNNGAWVIFDLPPVDGVMVGKTFKKETMTAHKVH